MDQMSSRGIGPRNGCKLEQPETFARANNRAFERVEFPTSQTGDSLGLRQQTLAFAEFVFRELLLGDVLRRAEDAQGPTGLVRKANGARLKNANAAVGQDETDFIFEGLLILEQGLHFLPDAHAVVVVK